MVDMTETQTTAQAHQLTGYYGEPHNYGAECSCGYSTGTWPTQRHAAKSHRTHQLEKAAEQGRADVAAGADPFKGLQPDVALWPGW